MGPIARCLNHMMPLASTAVGKPRLLWTPPSDSGKNLNDFREHVNRKRGLELAEYAGLHAWSIHPSTSHLFWTDLFEFLDIKHDGQSQHSVQQEPLEKAPMFPPVRFFPQVKLNFAENIFANARPSDVILHVCSEGAETIRDVTWRELRAQVERLADAMVSSGVHAGDRVAAIIGNRQETIACCLAALSIGAVWSSSSPDMGVDAVLSRLLQIRPKLVFCESEVLYNGKRRDLMAKNKKWAKALCTSDELHNIVVIPASGCVVEDADLKMISWHDFLGRGTDRPLSFNRLPFNHPAFIVYSSGTTGPPKCIVHSAGGLLLQVRKDGILHYDIRPGDAVLQYTTTGWIMWAMLLVSLSYRGRVVIYDGSPFVPDQMVLLRLIARLRVSCFGTSARFLTQLKTEALKPRELVDLSCLRTVTSTGSVLPAEVAEWFYAEGFPPHVHLHSTCGGTDMACSLITGNPTATLYSGEIQGPSLGMASTVFDADEEKPKPVRRAGDAGELVCTRPFPSQPVMFWGDRDGRKYRASYFERYGPLVWAQGDFVSMNPATGGFIVHGRSDGVLNPSGVRFGSAEIYSVVGAEPEVADSLCVGQRRPHDLDESVVLFVKMAAGARFSSRLKAKVERQIRTRLSPRHVPRYIFEVGDIPYTVNGKKVEVIVKKIISGIDVKPSASIANPQCLELYKRFSDVESADLEQSTRLQRAAL